MKTKNLVAIPPKGDFIDLTTGKEYPIFGVIGIEKNPLGRFFILLDDVGYRISTNEKHSRHIGGKNWKVKLAK